MQIILPWPNWKLSPNNRCHWRIKYKLRELQKAIGYNIAIENVPVKQSTYALHIIFHPPTRRGYDLDNSLSACKGYLDSIAEAWQVNDKNFRPITIDFGSIIKNGAVILKVI